MANKSEREPDHVSHVEIRLDAVRFIAELSAGVASALLTPFFPARIIERQLRLLFSDTRESENRRIEEKLASAMRSMQEASDYMGTLERQLAKQRENLESATKAHEHFQKLAATEKDKAEVFIKQMATEISRSTVRERWWAFAINMVAGLLLFVIGVFASDPVQNGIGALWQFIFSGDRPPTP